MKIQECICYKCQKSPVTMAIGNMCKFYYIDHAFLCEHCLAELVHDFMESE